jgi:hypothetical protein
MSGDAASAEATAVRTHRRRAKVKVSGNGVDVDGAGAGAGAGAAPVSGADAPGADVWRLVMPGEVLPPGYSYRLDVSDATKQWTNAPPPTADAVDDGAVPAPDADADDVLADTGADAAQARDRAIWQTAIGRMGNTLQTFAAKTDAATAAHAFKLMEEGPAEFKMRRDELDLPITASAGERLARRQLVNALLDEFKRHCNRVASELREQDKANKAAAKAAATDEAKDWPKPFYEMTEEEKATERAQLWPQCKALAGSPNIIIAAREALRAKGLVGEPRTTAAVLLQGVARLFPQPVSLALKGESASGKSRVSQSTLMLLPPWAQYRFTSATDKALIYIEDPARLKHAICVLAEASPLMRDDNATFALVIRELLSEGYVKHLVPSKVGDQIVTQAIELFGPTALLTTTTRTSIYIENETRLISLETDTSPEQTSRITKATAARHILPPVTLDLASWHALFRWIELGPLAVRVPFFAWVMENIKSNAIRMRRDHVQLHSLICASAMLHQASRGSNNGSITATEFDYEVARQIIAPTVNTAAGARANQYVLDVYRVIREEVEKAVRGGFTAADGDDGKATEAAAPDVRLLQEQVTMSDRELERRLPGRSRQSIQRDLQKTITEGLIVTDNRNRGARSRYSLGTLKPPGADTLGGGIKEGEAFPSRQELLAAKGDWAAAEARAIKLLRP